MGLTRSADIIATKTGWGRIWVGALLLGIATSLPELATAAASLKCSRSGGIRAIPNYNELIKFSDQLKPTTEIK